MSKYIKQADENAEMGMRTQIEPIIEVSEDCISREYLEEQLQLIEDITAMAHIDLGEDPYDETEEITMPISTVRKIFKNAPSVVPTTEQSSMVDEWCNDCKEYDKEKHCCPRWNKVIRRTVAEIREQSPMVGEWRKEYNGNGWNDYWDYTCPNCGKKYERADSVLYNSLFCPNCGAKMKGAEE